MTLASRIRLPHEGEWVDQLLREIKDAVREKRTVVVAGVDVIYSVCDSWPLGGEPAIYDHDGNIYLPEGYVRAHPTNAELVAFHEHIEISHKLAGRPHAYAHRRALLEELLAAKQIYDEDELRSYVKQRASGYPDSKIADKVAVEERLYELLAADRPLRGRLIEVITEARM